MKQKKSKRKAMSFVLTLVMVFSAFGMLPGVMQTGHAAMHYEVYVDDSISNGRVTSEPSETSGSGETVTLTVTPDDGYKLKKLSVIQPDVLNSISDLVDLMGDAVFSLENEYFVKIDEGKFSVFHNDEKIASLDNSENFTNTYGAGGYYTANTENSGFWAFYIIGGKLRTIYFYKSGTELDFTGTGAETISGTAIETTTVTEGTKYTFAAPRSNVYVTAEFETLDPKVETEKKPNPIRLTGKTVTLAQVAVKAKTRGLGRTTTMNMANQQGKLTFDIMAMNTNKYRKCFKIDRNSGVITVIRSTLPKGTYRMRVRVIASGNSTYKPIAKAVNVSIIIK